MICKFLCINFKNSFDDIPLHDFSLEIEYRIIVKIPNIYNHSDNESLKNDRKLICNKKYLDNVTKSDKRHFKSHQLHHLYSNKKLLTLS